MDKQDNNLCIVELPGNKNYSIVSPGRIVYGLNASKKELNSLINQERNLLRKFQRHGRKEKNNVNASLGIIPTFDCNLRCIYCYARGGDDKEYISVKMAKTAIIDLSKSYAKNHIDLYLVGGGEPLMNFQLITDIVDFAKYLYKSVGIHIVSNGTFDEIVLNWLIENKVDIRISYDGIMHDKQRPFAIGGLSKELVRKNIEYLVEHGLNPTIQCIITKNGTDTICNTLKDIAPLKIKKVKIEPALATDISRASTNLEPYPDLYARSLLKAIKYLASSKLDLKIDTGYFSEPSSGYYCGISENNKILTPQGFITSCVEVSKINDPYAEKIIYGKITTNGIKLYNRRQKALKSLHYSNQLDGCKNCNLRLICLGGCPMANIWRSGFSYKKSRFTCIVEHILIPELLIEIAENPRIADVILDEGVEMTSC